MTNMLTRDWWRSDLQYKLLEEFASGLNGSDPACSVLQTVADTKVPVWRAGMTMSGNGANDTRKESSAVQHSNVLETPAENPW